MKPINFLALTKYGAIMKRVTLLLCSLMIMNAALAMDRHRMIPEDWKTTSNISRQWFQLCGNKGNSFRCPLTIQATSSEQGQELLEYKVISWIPEDEMNLPRLMLLQTIFDPVENENIRTLNFMAHEQTAFKAILRHIHKPEYKDFFWQDLEETLKKKEFQEKYKVKVTFEKTTFKPNWFQKLCSREVITPLLTGLIGIGLGVFGGTLLQKK